MFKTLSQKLGLFGFLSLLSLLPLAAHAVCGTVQLCGEYQVFRFANGNQIATCIDGSLHPASGMSVNGIYKETTSKVDGFTQYNCQPLPVYGEPRRFPVSSSWKAGLIQGQNETGSFAAVADFYPSSSAFVAAQVGSSVLVIDQNYYSYLLYRGPGRGLFLEEDLAMTPRAPGVGNFRTQDIKVNGKPAALALLEVLPSGGQRRAAVYIVEPTGGTGMFAGSSNRYFLGIQPTDEKLSVKFDVQKAFENAKLFPTSY